MRQRARTLARLALVLFGIALAFSVFEVALRLKGYQGIRWPNRVNTQIVSATDNVELPYVLTPGAEGYGWDTDITVNSHGFRDREFSEEKGDRFRIAAIGDSITFRSRLPPPALYPKQLEQLLQSRSPSSHAEVLNFGVTGYDVVNNVEHLRVRALTFQPDVVLLGFCVNDIGTSSTAIGYIGVAKYLSHPVFRLRVSQYLVNTGLRRIATNRSIDDDDIDAFQGINRVRILPIGDDLELSGQIDELVGLGPSRVSPGLAQWWTQPPRIGFLEYSFNKLRELKRQHGFEVVVVAIPMLDPGNTERWRLVHQIIRHESHKYGFHFVDVFEDFEKRGLRKLRNTPSDMIHPNADGHAIVAEGVYDYLVGSNLLRVAQ